MEFCDEEQQEEWKLSTVDNTVRYIGNSVVHSHTVVLFKNVSSLMLGRVALYVSTVFMCKDIYMYMYVHVYVDPS